MKKNIAIVAGILLLFSANIPCFANAETDLLFRKSISLVKQKQDYESAIGELRKALRIDYKDTKLLVRLIRLYMTRGEQYTDFGEWGKAVNDYRSALFYFYNFVPLQVQKTGAYNKVRLKLEKQLELCYKNLKYRKSSKNRYKTAVVLEMAKEYPAAGYEYMLARSGSRKYAPDCITRLKFVYGMMGIKHKRP